MLCECYVNEVILRLGSNGSQSCIDRDTHTPGLCLADWYDDEEVAGLCCVCLSNIQYSIETDVHPPEHWSGLHQNYFGALQVINIG